MCKVCFPCLKQKMKKISTKSLHSMWRLYLRLKFCTTNYYWCWDWINNIWHIADLSVFAFLSGLLRWNCCLAMMSCINSKKPVRAKINRLLNLITGCANLSSCCHHVVAKHINYFLISLWGNVGLYFLNSCAILCNQEISRVVYLKVF